MEVLSRFHMGRDLSTQTQEWDAAFTEIRGEVDYGGYRNRWSRIFDGGKTG